MKKFAEWLIYKDPGMFEGMAGKERMQDALYKGGLHKLKQVLNKTTDLYNTDEEVLNYLSKKIDKAKDDEDYHSPYLLNRIANELEQNFNNLPPATSRSPMSRAKDALVDKIVQQIQGLIKDHSKEHIADIIGKVKTAYDVDTVPDARRKKGADHEKPAPGFTRSYEIPDKGDPEEFIAGIMGHDLKKLRRALG